MHTRNASWYHTNRKLAAIIYSTLLSSSMVSCPGFLDLQDFVTRSDKITQKLIGNAKSQVHNKARYAELEPVLLQAPTAQDLNKSSHGHFLPSRLEMDMLRVRQHISLSV
jgi:hypothetical protein